MLSSYCKEGLGEECPVHRRRNNGHRFTCTNPAHTSKKVTAEEARDGKKRNQIGGELWK